MTPREPDRFEAKARELFPEHVTCTPSCTYIARAAAALRAAESEALERAERKLIEMSDSYVERSQKEYERQGRSETALKLGAMAKALDEGVTAVRALKPDPAAAPAACPEMLLDHRCDEEGPHEQHRAENAGEGGADLVWRTAAAHAAGLVVCEYCEYPHPLNDDGTKCRFPRPAPVAEEPQAIPVPVKDPFFLVRCADCGYCSSSEQWGTASYGDDADILCPRCGSSRNDEPWRIAPAAETEKHTPHCDAAHWKKSCSCPPAPAQEAEALLKECEEAMKVRQHDGMSPGTIRELLAKLAARASPQTGEGR